LRLRASHRDQLEITLEENQLIVRGRQVEDKARHFPSPRNRRRQFQRTFLLAEGMEVLGADLSNGLLSIDLARPSRRGSSARSISRQGQGVTARVPECHMNENNENEPDPHGTGRSRHPGRGPCGIREAAAVRGREQALSPGAADRARSAALRAAFRERHAILVTDSRDAAVANAWEHDLETVSLH
jgi:hypothetical protein